MSKTTAIAHPIHEQQFPTPARPNGEIPRTNVNRTTAHRWQTMAWAAACSGKLVEDDPVRAANAAGRSLWYTRLVMERLTFDQLEAAIDPSAAKSFRKIEQGVPQRAPDLGAVGRE